MADYANHRVVLLSLAGNELDTEPLSVWSHADLTFPTCIVQCRAPDGDVMLFVACCEAAGSRTRLMKLGFRLGSVDKPDCGDGQFSCVSGLATLQGGGLIALEDRTRCFQVFTSLVLRLSWIRLAVSWQRQRCQRPVQAVKRSRWDQPSHAMTHLARGCLSTEDVVFQPRDFE